MANNNIATFDMETTVHARLTEGKHTAILQLPILAEGESSQYFIVDMTLEDGRTHRVLWFPNDIRSSMADIVGQHPNLAGKSLPDFISSLKGLEVDMWYHRNYSVKKKQWYNNYYFSAPLEAAETQVIVNTDDSDDEENPFA